MSMLYRQCNLSRQTAFLPIVANSILQQQHPGGAFYADRNPPSATASFPQRRAFVLACLGLEHLVTCHDVRDLHIHGHLHEYMYVRMLGCMSTPLYVHVMHTHTQNIHTCLGLYACIF